MFLVFYRDETINVLTQSWSLVTMASRRRAKAQEILSEDDDVIQNEALKPSKRRYNILHFMCTVFC